MKIWKKSLMTRLAGYFLLLSLLTVSLAGYIAYRKATSLIKESVFDRVDAVATVKENDLNQWVEAQRQSIVLLAHLPEVRHHAAIVLRLEQQDDTYQTAYSFLSETLDALAVGNSDMQEIFILTDTSGCVVISTSKDNEGKFRAQDTYFIEGRKTTYIQSVYASPLTLKPTISIATPLVDEKGNRMGVIAAHIRLDRLDTMMLEHTGLGSSGEIYLIDTLNAFVSSERFGREQFRNSVHTEGINAALAGNNGSGLYTNYRGVPVIGAYRWIDELQLALLVEMSQEEALTPARNLAWHILLIGSSAAWILTVGVYLLSRQITRPILAITDAAGKIAVGDLTTKAPVLTEDEVGKLAHTFNQMTNELRTLYHSLREQQEHLEEQVAQRTHELSRINTILVNEVAERKQTEKALQKAKESAEAANRAKSTFLANMSHELRTPLNAIIGFTQLMGRDKTLAPEHMERLHIVERSGEHLLNLINDVLEMSKIEAGRTTLQEQKFDLQTLLQDLIHMFSLRAKNKQLHLYQYLDADIPKYVYADEGKLRQVLINLLSNAIKFTTSGSITLRVGVEPDISQMWHSVRGHPNQEAQARPHEVCIVRFEIEDTGAGIAAKELPNLFDAFVQTSSGQKSKEGTGLGLSISQHFVRLMGGSLHVQSEIGHGSTFTCSVPLGVVESADVVAKKSAQHIVGLAPNQPIYRILIVEDMRDSRKLMTDLLVPLGFDVKEASNGQEGIEVWQTWAPHLIFMDIRMPVMDGYMATKHIKEAAKDTKPAIIALTASAFEEQRNHMLAVGCDDFIRKPFQHSDILTMMQKHIGVQFLYAQSTQYPMSHHVPHHIEASGSEQQPSSAPLLVDSRALASLPDSVLDHLCQATVETNPDMINAMIDQIRCHNHALADALLALANDFEYTSILTLIQEAREKDV